jgi:outer membrane receptor for ferrienterochelin and colicin
MSITAYTNIDGYIVQGLESSVRGRIERVAGLFDFSASLGYVYSYARNYDDSTATKGESVEKLPVHQIVARFTLDFITKTSLLLWGTYANNQVQYVMTADPTPTYAGTFTTDAYTTVRLHDPLMVNVRLSQRLMDHFEVYVMCKNIFDDYNADPFNPGPGRMFYFGGGAKL